MFFKAIMLNIILIIVSLHFVKALDNCQNICYNTHYTNYDDQCNRFVNIKHCKNLCHSECYTFPKDSFSFHKNVLVEMKCKYTNNDFITYYGVAHVFSKGMVQNNNRMSYTKDQCIDEMLYNKFKHRVRFFNTYCFLTGLFVLYVLTMLCTVAFYLYKWLKSFTPTFALFLTGCFVFNVFVLFAIQEVNYFRK